MLDLATIGIALETTGLEKGQAALKIVEEAANRAATAADKTSTSFAGMGGASGKAGEAAQNLTQKIENKIRAMQIEADTFGMSARQAQSYTLAMGGANLAQITQADTIRKNIEAMKAGREASSASDKLTQSINQQIQKLQDQANTFGMSERKAQTYALAMQGASKAQIEHADAIKKDIEAMERGREIGEKMGSAIKAGALLVVGAATAAAYAFEKLIGNVAKYQDLAEQTGGDPAGLAKLRTAADVGGSSVEALAGVANRMQQRLAAVGDESKGVVKALQSIGIQVDDFKSKRPDEQLMMVAKALDQYADGGGKVATMQEIYGRGAANLLPTFKEMAAQTEKQNGLTKEQIQLADDYKDAQARSRSELMQFAEVMAIPVLSAVVEMTGAMKDVIKQMAGVGDEANALKANAAIASFARDSAIALAELMDAITRAGSALLALKGSLNVIMADISTSFKFATTVFSAFAPGDVFAKQNEALKKATDEREKTLKDANERYANIGSIGLAEKLKGRFAQQDYAATFGMNSDQKNLDWEGKGKPKLDDPNFKKDPKPKKPDNRAENLAIKMAYDEQINDLKAYADEAKFITAEMVKDIEAIHKRGVVSDYDYYAKKNDAALNGITDQKAILELEIAVAKASKLPLLEKQKAIEAFQKALQDLNQAQTALNADFIRQEDALNAKVAEAMDKRLDIVKKATQTLVAEQKALTQEREEFGLTEQQLRSLQLARADEMATALERKAVTLDSIDLYNDESAELRKQAELIRSNAKLRVENAGAKEIQSQWKSFYADLERGLTDSLFRAFESGKGFFKTLWDGIKNLFKTTVLKLAINGTVSAAGQALGISGAGAGTSALGLANNASSLYTLGGVANTAYNGGVSGLVSTYAGSGSTLGYYSGLSSVSPGAVTSANAIGAAGGDSLGALATSQGWAAAGGSGLSASTGAVAATDGIAGGATLFASESAPLAATALGTGEVVGGAVVGGEVVGGGLAAGLGAIPVYGWIALAAIAAFAIFSKESKPTASRGDASVTYDGAGNETDRKAIDTYSYSAARGGMADSIVKGLQADYSRTATALGIKPGQATFGYASNTGEGGEHNNFDISGQVGGSNYHAGETAESPEALSLAASRAVFAALKGSEMPKYLAGVFNNLDAGKMTGEQVASALAGAQALKNFNAQLLKMPFANLAELSYTATQGLMAAVGGFDALQNKLGSYIQNYFSQEEQRAQAIKNINEATAGSGLDAATATRASFRALVEAQDVTTDSGLRTYAALLNVADAFAAMTPAADAATTAINANAEAIKANAEAIKAGAQAYRDKFFSDAEKAASAAAMVGAQFAAIGQSVPSSRAAFRSLVEAQDLNTTAGKTLRDALMTLAPAFDAATSDADQAAQAMMDARSNLLKSRLDTVTASASGAYETLSRAVKAQQDRDNAAYEAQKAIATAAFTSQAAVMQSSIDGVKASLDAVGQSIGKLKSLSGSLKSTLDGMRVIGSEQTYRTGAQAQISGALATARSGGGLPLGGEIESALRTVSKPSEQLFASFTDYARDFYKTANDIAALSDITDAQLSADEITQGILRAQSDTLNEQQKRLKDGFAAQVSSLNGILENARRQLDAANGINQSVLSVADALAAFNSSIQALATERTAQGMPADGGGAAADYFTKNADVKAAYGQNSYGLNATEFAGVHYGIYGAEEGRTSPIAAPAPTAKSYFQLYPDVAAAFTAMSDTDKALYNIETQKAFSARHFADFGKAEGRTYPGFAAGGSFGGGMRIVGENGPELEATGPSRIFNAQQTRSMIGGDTKALEALIAKLTEKVAALQVSAERGNANTARVANTLEGQQGVPFLVEIAA